MDPGERKVRAFRSEVLRRFVAIAAVASLAVLPAYHLIGITPLTLACALYSAVVLLLWGLHRDRRREIERCAGLFLGATLAIMLCGLALGDERIDNKPWQMVFPLAAFLVAGPRAGARWAAAAWLGCALVFALRWPTYSAHAMFIFLAAHATICYALGIFARSNEDNIRTISRLSHTDTLTKTYNRQLFDELVGNAFNRARRAQEPLAVLMIDIDYFKLYNDNYGHVAGDRALEQVAGVIRRSARRATDLVFRYGGEEFCVVSAGVTRADAAHVAATILGNVRELAIPHAASPRGRLTVSVGLGYQYTVGSEAPERLIERADRALYLAKTGGRDRCEIDGDEDADAEARARRPRAERRR
jgi:diguanylate cyclase (GGDEF)-like protein